MSLSFSAKKKNSTLISQFFKNCFVAYLSSEKEIKHIYIGGPDTFSFKYSVFRLSYNLFNNRVN